MLEGAQISTATLVTGNPAFDAGSVQRSSSWCCWKLGTIKAMWLVAELYSFFGLLLVGQVLLNDRLPNNWRYTPLCFCFLLIAISSTLSLVVSIILKWIMIGRRRPGPYVGTLLRTSADWMVDYHFQIGAMLWHYSYLNSRIWNVILILHGMDIDFASRLTRAMIDFQARLGQCQALLCGKPQLRNQAKWCVPSD